MKSITPFSEVRAESIALARHDGAAPQETVRRALSSVPVPLLMESTCDALCARTVTDSDVPAQA